MAFPVRACALIGRFSDPRVAESVGVLLPQLKSRCSQVLVIDNGDLPDWLNSDVVPLPEDQIARSRRQQVDTVHLTTAGHDRLQAGERAGIAVAVGGADVGLPPLSCP